MKRNTIFRMLIIFILLFLGLSIGLGQSANNTSVKKENNPKYKIVISEYVDYEGKTFLLTVYIKSKYLNREDMKILAKNIKADFPKENKIHVVFFTNKQSAKTFSLNQHSKDYDKNKEAFRGSYRLNRETGEEVLTFAPIGRKSTEREEIDLSEKNQNQ